MRQYALLAFCGLFCLLPSLAITAQPPPWVVYLMDESEGETLTVVNAVGEQIAQHTLYRPEDFAPGDGRANVEASPDGRLIAYTPTHVETGRVHFVVYDLQAGEARLDVPIPEGFEMQMSTHSGGVFTPGNTAVTFGLSNEEELDTWAIYRLPLDGALSPPLTPLFTQDDVPNPPDWTESATPVYHTEDAIYFYIGQFLYHNYRWQDGEIAPHVSLYGLGYADLLPFAGAAISAVEDKRYPTFFDYRGLGEHNHAVSFWQRGMTERVTVFSAPDIWIVSITFAQDGQKVWLAVREQDPLTNDQTNARYLIDLYTGQLLQVYRESPLPSGAHNVPDGLVFTVLQDDDQRDLQYLDTTGGPPYQAVTLYEDVPARGILWAGVPGRPAEDPLLGTPPEAYTPTPAASVPMVSATPTHTPTPTLRPLATGAEVVAFLLEGGRLNVRQEPSTAFPVVATLTTGEGVRVVDGPVLAEGLTWWQVETAEGVVGWAVDGLVADGRYIPALVFPEENAALRTQAAPTLTPTASPTATQTTIPPTWTRRPTLTPVTRQPSATPTGAPSATPTASWTPRPAQTRTPSPTPDQTEGLQVGVIATVVLPDGGSLNARSEPSTAFPVVRQFADGDLVIVLDGPVLAEGLAWWQVRPADGQEPMWLVEAIVEDRQLVPVLERGRRGEEQEP